MLQRAHNHSPQLSEKPQHKDSSVRKNNEGKKPSVPRAPHVPSGSGAISNPVIFTTLPSPVSSVVRLTGSWASSRLAQWKEHVLWSLSPLPLASVVALVRHTLSLRVSEHCPGDPVRCPLSTGQRGGAGAQHAATKAPQSGSLWASTVLCGESLCLVHRLPL